MLSFAVKMACKHNTNMKCRSVCVWGGGVGFLFVCVWCGFCFV